jgi:hypothetical protein
VSGQISSRFGMMYDVDKNEEFRGVHIMKKLL